MKMIPQPTEFGLQQKKKKSVNEVFLFLLDYWRDMRT